VVTDAVMERNGLGYSGTNASGGLFVVNSVFRRNRIGVSPNSQNMERLAPQGDIVIAGNLVEDNDDPGAPPAASGAFGFGIAVGGGERNQIIRNRVRDNGNVGIALTSLESFLPSGNRVEGNELSNNGTDLAFYSAASGPLQSAGNCFVGNQFVSSAPVDIETELACDALAHGVTVDGAPFQQTGPPGADYRKIPLPGSQPGMADPLTAPAVPAQAKVPSMDLASIKVPV
jgi:Right handed beta helix region